MKKQTKKSKEREKEDTAKNQGIRKLNKQNKKNFIRDKYKYKYKFSVVYCSHIETRSDLCSVPFDVYIAVDSFGGGSFPWSSTTYPKNNTPST